MKKKFKIEPYNPNWALQYQEERKKIAPIFGGNLEAIHHIGSTAIPKMMAKPEIDILVVIKDEAVIPMHNIEIAKLGYAIRGAFPQNDALPPRFYYSKDSDYVRTHKLHVCKKGHPAIDALCLFVEYLSTHEDEAMAYANLKIELSEKFNYGRIGEYLAHKGEFIAQILEKAREELKPT